MAFIGELREKWDSGKLPVNNEKVVSFVLACFLKQQRDQHSQYAFEVEKINNIGNSNHSARFSPDVDVWEQVQGCPMSVNAYEVKGYSGDSSNQKSKIYSGIGQALTLLTQPYNHDPVFEHVYLAIPKQSLDRNWATAVLRAISKTPVGCIAIGLEGYETVVEADRNPFYTDNPRQTPEMVTAMVSDPKTVHRPGSGMYKRARQLQDEFNF
ncbi:hypothetical protein [Halostagnicola sp. A-GB9-2]|uniref:hypothetical protein n=1 Tax=Halostagnicola sp. A-GB9-2 TaxID=3048066 RepID=UPI0024C04D68|nr:hypothetical protein [Halostagnicola sp. A-GB9-2]MDJ1431159.1 hypothetical protein [Halostagnicola sp. A-GB9-2]